MLIFLCTRIQYNLCSIQFKVIDSIFLLHEIYKFTFVNLLLQKFTCASNIFVKSVKLRYFTLFHQNRVDSICSIYLVNLLRVHL